MSNELERSVEGLIQENESLKEALREAQEAINSMMVSPIDCVPVLGSGPEFVEGVPTAIVTYGENRTLVPLLPSCDLTDASFAYVTKSGCAIGPAPKPDSLPLSVVRVREIEGERIFCEIQDGAGLVEFIRAKDFLEPVRAGDRVLVSSSTGILFEKLPDTPASSEWAIEQTPKERFKDIGAQDSLLKTLEERFFWPLLWPEYMEMLGLSRSAGILLYGPSGCGKTLTGKALAGEIADRLGGDFHFLRVKAGSLKSKWYGETTQRIIALFKAMRNEAREGKHVILFLDEVDALGRQRTEEEAGYGRGADQDATNAFLSEMEGVDTDRSLSITVVASTNFPQSLDSAFKGRFGVTIPVPRPDRKGAASILGKFLQSLPLGEEIEVLQNATTNFIYEKGNELVEFEIERTRTTIKREHLVTGRLLRDSVEDAKWKVMEEVVGGKGKKKTPKLTTSHLLPALDEQFNRIASLLTPHNLGHFVDIDTL